MPSIDIPYSQEEQTLLLSIAAKSIESGLKNNNPLFIELSHYPPTLSDIRATFVTLEINKQLRGCIGRLLASRPLAEDVAENAYSAAFNDPRFPKLSSVEFSNLDIHISILSEPEPISFKNEDDLLQKIRPSTDGLILSEDYQRGTFLPSVWESIPDTKNFLRHLKEKAGLPFDYWSNNIKVERYTTFSFGALIAEIEV